jgi:hypothetical protein
MPSKSNQSSKQYDWHDVRQRVICFHSGIATVGSEQYIAADPARPARFVCHMTPAMPIGSMHQMLLQSGTSIIQKHGVFGL